MPVLRASLRRWLPLALAIAMLSMAAYTFAQQVYRQSANDPQVQLAEDAARAIGGGAAPAAVVGSMKVDAATSLAPFVVVYDETGRPSAASATLDGKVPQVPKGALDAAKAGGANSVTWQPREGLRFATVERPLKSGGTVMAARSLREVEARVSTLTLLFVLAVIGTLASTFALTLGVEWYWAAKGWSGQVNASNGAA